MRLRREPLTGLLLAETEDANLDASFLTRADSARLAAEPSSIYNESQGSTRCLGA